MTKHELSTAASCWMLEEGATAVVAVAGVAAVAAGSRIWLRSKMAGLVAHSIASYIIPGKGKGKAEGGGDAFVSEGFSCWKSKDRLNIHVGDHDSSHNKARIKCEALMNQEQHIQPAFFKQSKQLALVAVTKKNTLISNFFRLVADVVNIVGISSKRCDHLQEKQEDIWCESIGECLLAIFSAVIDVLEMISVDGSNSDKKGEAYNLLESIQSFDFAFNLHLMRTVLAMTNELSKALQRKDQDIVNAMELMKLCKQRLQSFRDDGWDSFLQQVYSFCQVHYIDVTNIDDMFICRAPHGRPQRQSLEMTYLHHFHADLFYVVINMQLQELNDHFSEANT
ncbi:uncharacterized protein LOC127811856 [Diospyros lotus]|uniref:uncharacterized protein LOC127811856 n=1 Tax=Diospyros lotus TaxID=55363 RepID=UPI00224E3A69|nr:uncharacterized protein LOC127811856 [Diospyros lotus]